MTGVRSLSGCVRSTTRTAPPARASSRAVVGSASRFLSCGRLAGASRRACRRVPPDGAPRRSPTRSAARSRGLGVDTVFGLAGSGNFVVTNALVAGGARFVSARHEGGAVAMADGWARTTGRVGRGQRAPGAGPDEHAHRAGRGGQGAHAARRAGRRHAARARCARTSASTSTTSCGRSAPLPELLYCAGDGRRRRGAGAAARAARAPAGRADDADRPAGRRRRRTPRDRAAVPLPAPPAPAPPRRSRAPPTCSRPRERPGDRRRARRRAGRRARRRRGARRADRRAAGHLGDGPRPVRRPALRARHRRRLRLAARRRAAGATPTSSLALGAALNHWTTRHGALLGRGRAAHPGRRRRRRAIGAHQPADGRRSSATRRRPRARCWPSSRRAATAPRAGARRRSRRRSPRAAGATSPTTTRPPPGTIDPRTLAIALDDLLPPDRAVAVDSGAFTGWPAMYLDVADPRAWLFCNAFQSVGLGFGAALGAAVARPGSHHRRRARRRRAVPRAARARHRRPPRPAGPRRRVGRRRVRRRGAPLRPDGRGRRHRPVPGRRPRRDRPRAPACPAHTVRGVADLEPVAAWAADPTGPLLVDAKVDPGSPATGSRRRSGAADGPRRSAAAPTSRHGRRRSAVSRDLHVAEAGEPARDALARRAPRRRRRPSRR